MSKSLLRGLMPPMDGAGVGNGSAAKRWDPVEQAQHATLQTPKEILNGEIDQIVSARLASVRSQVEAWLNQPKVYEEISSRNHPTEDRPLTEREFQTKVQGALAAKIAEITAAETSPILRDPSGMIARAGFADHLDPVHLEGVCMQRFREGISATVGDVYKERQEATDRVALDAKEVQALADRIEIEKRGAFFKEIGETPVDKISSEKLDDWIKKGAARLSKDERQRLVNTGLIELEGTDPGPRNGPDTFRRLRALSNLSWAVSMPIIVGLAEANLSGVFGDVRSGTIALGIIGAAAIGNLVCQFALSRRRQNQMKNIWHEAKSELSGVDLDRAVAWTGIMYKIVSQLSPVYLLKNRTDMLNGGQPSSVSAVLGHLKLAACVAVDSQLNKEGDRYYKGVNYKDKIALTENGLKDLATRWNWAGWDISDRVAALVGLGVPTLSYFAYVELLKAL